MRRRFGRRRFSRPKAPLRLAWVNTLFTGTISVTSGQRTALVLLDDDDWAANVASTAKNVVVRRIIVSYCYLPSLDFAGDASQAHAVLSGVVLEDEDEADTNIVTTAAGSLWTQNRWLYSAMYGGFLNIPDVDVHTVYTVCPTQRVDWKGKMMMRSGQLLTHSHQLMTDVSSSLSAFSVNAIARVLIESP